MVPHVRLTSHSDESIYLRGPDLTSGSRCGYMFTLHEGVSCRLTIEHIVADNDSDDKDKDDPLSLDYTKAKYEFIRIEESGSVHFTRAKDVVKCVIKLESELKPDSYNMYASESQHIILEISRPRRNTTKPEFDCWDIRQI
eukprot:TRINITY_DN1525_c0_g3_i1.p1 TRINITY_DN1525_c0_g3~~TRINITY_DN1525_c0_g3_i1.p1  ORF type:complete len:141 (+),score=10.71 TRINITY_DN1525_c0_g3_i1:247-669(+)